MCGPPAPGADLGQKPVDVRHDWRRNVSCQDSFKVPTGQAVLAFQEEGACQFQPDPGQIGIGG